MFESFKIRGAIVLFVLFLLSGYYSLQEMRYFVMGRVVDATVDQVEVRSERVYRRRYGSTTREYKQATVHFLRPDNILETGTLRLENHEPVRTQQSLKIQYLPGQPDMMRLSGRPNWIAVMFFLGSLMALAGVIVWVGMEANRPYASTRLANADRPVRPTLPKKKKRTLKPLKPLDE